MIIGIGVDTVQLSRFEAKLAETPRLKDRLFLDIETVNDGAEASVQTLAGRFAAKEALAKALHVPAGLNWQDCEVINLENGRPVFLFHNQIAELIDGADVHLSLSHDAGIASAMVVIER